MTISLIKTSAAQNYLKNIIFLHSHILCSFFWISFHFISFIFHLASIDDYPCVLCIHNFKFFLLHSFT